MQIPGFMSAARLLLATGTLFLLSIHSLALTPPVRPTSFPLSRPSGPGVTVGWGDNTYGAAAVPTAVRSNLVAIAAGGYHNIGLFADGRVAVWGFSAFGQNTIPLGATNVVAVAEGNGHCLVLRADGTLVAWGEPSEGRIAIPTGLSNVVAIAAGGGHSLALKIDGTVVAWGWNSNGQTNVPPGLTNVVAVAAGFRHSIALKQDGTVIAWGANDNGQTSVPVSLTNVVAIDGGGGLDAKGDITMALKADGGLAIWGDSSKGQLAIPAGLTNVSSITCGFYYAAAIDNSGKLWVWGTTSAGEGNVPNFSATAVSGGNFHILAFRPYILPPSEAIATAQVVNGFVVGINVVNGGSGYTNPPTVQISGGNGTGAAATAIIQNGSVVGFNITSAGTGYTGTPTIKILGHPFEEKLTVALSKIKVTMEVLVNATYRLESSADFTQWSSVGSLFIATQPEIELEFPLAETGRFFRLTRQ